MDPAVELPPAGEGLSGCFLFQADQVDPAVHGVAEDRLHVVEGRLRHVHRVDARQARDLGDEVIASGSLRASLTRTCGHSTDGSDARRRLGEKTSSPARPSANAFHRSSSSSSTCESILLSRSFRSDAIIRHLRQQSLWNPHTADIISHACSGINHNPANGSPRYGIRHVQSEWATATGNHTCMHRRRSYGFVGPHSVTGQEDLQPRLPPTRRVHANRDTVVSVCV